MKPEGSLSRSQDCAAGPYPDTYDSSPHTHVQFISDTFSYYLPLLRLPTKTVYIFLLPPMRTTCLSIVSSFDLYRK
jgi:hypothetical protein